MSFGAKEPMRIGIVASHPVQYHAAFYRELAQRSNIEIEVMYCCRWGHDTYRDPGFGVEFAWDLPLLEGYPSAFLRNLSLRAGPGRFLGCINTGVLTPILRRRFDALLLTNWATASVWLAWSAAQVAGTPVLLRAEGNSVPAAAGVGGRARRSAVRLFLNGVSAFLAIGTCNWRYWDAYGVPRDLVFHSPYAVENGRFSCLQSCGKTALRSRLGLDPLRPVILFSGKLIGKKRPDDLLAAYRRIAATQPCSLVFVGDGALRNELEAACKQGDVGDVRFLGFKNQTEIPPIYAMADVLVLPSSFEPWGLVVNEAMASGLAVVASDRVGAAADLVRHGVNGFTYPAGDVGALADLLLQLVRSPGMMASMGKASRDIIGPWSMEAAADGVVEALQWTVSSRRGVTRARRDLPGGSHEALSPLVDTESPDRVSGGVCHCHHDAPSPAQNGERGR